MADAEGDGLTAREAVERFCEYWTWAGTVGTDPADREQALKKAVRELTAMLKHELAEFQPAGVKRKARSRLRQKGLQPFTDELSRDGMNEQAKSLMKRAKRKGIDLGVDGAVSRIVMAGKRDPDLSTGPEPVPLWATGHKGSTIDTPAVPFSPEQWADLTLDIEDNSALDGDVRYVGLRFYDVEPVGPAANAESDTVDKGQKQRKALTRDPEPQAPRGKPRCNEAKVRQAYKERVEN
jgi:hypothetical protein